MQNPWIDLPKVSPYVLPSEAGAIARFNLGAKEMHRIGLELMPEAYLGNPLAPIVLLNLNPGFMEAEIPFHRDDEYFKSQSRKTLLHLEQEYPFYLLDPNLSNSEGHKWWRKKLRQPIEIGGLLRVASTFFCVEYFPYHSTKFKPMSEDLGSQMYGWQLVRNAMKRQCVIVVMRSKRLWFGAIPELETYPRFYELRNVQNVTISPGNCPKAWPLIEEMLK